MTSDWNQRYQKAVDDIARKYVKITKELNSIVDEGVEDSTQSSYIYTVSGAKVDVFNPNPTDIRLYDIAYALASKVRFSGFANPPYTVLQHSLLVAEHVQPQCQAEALFHDASEAYLVDLPRPIKDELRRQGVTVFDELEEKLSNAIACKFDLQYPWPPEVKLADDCALLTEIRDVMPSKSTYWILDNKSATAFDGPIIVRDREDLIAEFIDKVCCAYIS